MKVVYHRTTEYQSGGFLLKQTATGSFIVVLLLALQCRCSGEILPQVNIFLFINSSTRLYPVHTPIFFILRFTIFWSVIHANTGTIHSPVNGFNNAVNGRECHLVRTVFASLLKEYTVFSRSVGLRTILYLIMIYRVKPSGQKVLLKNYHLNGHMLWHYSSA